MTPTADQPSQELVEVEQILKEKKAQIAAVLPQHIGVDKFIAVAMDLVSQDSKLSHCTSESILKGVLEASQLGLMLTKNLGHGYLVPFKSGQLTAKHKRDVYECQFMVGYRGFIHMMKKADPDIQTIFADLVMDGETVELDPRDRCILHAPSLTRGHVNVSSNGGETTGYVGAYCKIIYKNGMQDYEWMSREEIEKVRKAGKASGDRSPWKTWADPMIKKCPIRQIAKRLDLVLVTEAAVRDESRELGIESATDITPAQIAIPQRKSEAATAPSPDPAPSNGALAPNTPYTGPIVGYQPSTQEKRPHRLTILTEHGGDLEVSFFERPEALKALADPDDALHMAVTIQFTETVRGDKTYRNLSAFDLVPSGDVETVSA